MQRTNRSARPQMSSSYTRGRLIAASALVLATGVLAACSALSANESTKAHVVYGAAQSLGSGSARVFATIGGDNEITSLGVAISEAAMGTLPTTPIPPSPSAATLLFKLPDEAKGKGFDHVMLDWNPAGHEPEHVYTLPHFDFHFYSATEAEQMAIVPNAPGFETRAANLPDSSYAPSGFVAAHLLMNAPAAAATVPMMGLHWLDGSSSELHGATFTKTFIWGSYDGRFIFLEPMITKAYIESAKTATGNALVTDLRSPAKYQHPGYYPARYSITWDAAAKEYRISLDGLKQQF